MFFEHRGASRGFLQLPWKKPTDVDAALLKLKRLNLCFRIRNQKLKLPEQSKLSALLKHEQTCRKAGIGIGRCLALSWMQNTKHREHELFPS